MTASASALAWQLLWIKQWTDAYTSNSVVDKTVWVWGLVAICVTDGILFLHLVFVTRITTRAS